MDELRTTSQSQRRRPDSQVGKFSGTPFLRIFKGYTMICLEVASGPEVRERAPSRSKAKWEPRGNDTLRARVRVSVRLSVHACVRVNVQVCVEG